MWHCILHKLGKGALLPHPRLAPHHLRTVPLPGGWLLSTFAAHDTPGYEAVVRHIRRNGGDCRRYSWTCEGVIEVKWREAVAE